MKVNGIYKMEMGYMVFEDKKNGHQMAVVGVIPALGRVLVIDSARVSRAQEGGTRFGVVSKAVEAEILAAFGIKAPGGVADSKKAGPSKDAKKKGGATAAVPAVLKAPK